MLRLIEESPTVVVTVTFTLPNGQRLSVREEAKPMNLEFELKTIAERGARFAQDAYPFAVT